jgi:hypothetical protein
MAMLVCCCMTLTTPARGQHRDYFCKRSTGLLLAALDVATLM